MRVKEAGYKNDMWDMFRLFKKQNPNLYIWRCQVTFQNLTDTVFLVIILSFYSIFF